MMTQNTNVNAQPFQMEKSVRFNVSNETMEEKTVRVVWDVRSRFGDVLRAEEEELVVPALSSVWMDKVEIPELKIDEEYVSYELFEGEQWVSGSTVLLTLPKFSGMRIRGLRWRLVKVRLLYGRRRMRGVWRSGMRMRI